MKDLLDRLSKAVGALAGDSAETPEVDGPEDMNLEAFTVYVTEELEKAAKDTPEVKIARLKALAEQIELAKNFEGRPAMPGGILRVQRFKDPGQRSTTEATRQPSNASATTQFTAGPEAHPPGMASTPPGGKMPPLTAGGSGFDSPATATFAKALEALTKTIGELEGKTPEQIKAESEEAAKVAKANEGKSADEAKVAKAKESAAFWPLDMNTPFGRGETDASETPEWGLDHGKAPAAKPAAATAE